MESSQVEIGDIYKVVNCLYVYNGHDDFAIKAGHLDLLVNKCFTNGDKRHVYDKLVRVLYIGSTDKQPMKMIAIVEMVDNPEHLKFMIDPAGLKFEEQGWSRDERTAKQRRDYLLEDYLLGKPLTEKVPDYCVDALLIKAIVNRNPLDLQYINATLLSDKIYARVLRKDGGLLGLVPEERRTLTLCEIAIFEEQYAERFIPQKLRSLVKY